MDTDSLFDSCSGLVAELTKTYKGWEGVSQFKNTPNRLVRMYSDFCWSPSRIKDELDKHFKVYPNSYDEMLVTGPMEVWVLCPHHLLPVKLECWIGYVPDGGVLGLSKFARISRIMGKRPIMQEQYSTELTDELDRRLSPKGLGVVVVGTHGCMVSRGVEQDSKVVTSCLRGCILDKPQTREEFYSVVESLRKERR